jgi:hypothetical protein
VSGTEADVVAGARAHAWDAHGMELSAQLARALARPRTLPMSQEADGDAHG